VCGLYLISSYCYSLPSSQLSTDISATYGRDVSCDVFINVITNSSGGPASAITDISINQSINEHFKVAKLRSASEGLVSVQQIVSK